MFRGKGGLLCCPRGIWRRLAGSVVRGLVRGVVRGLRGLAVVGGRVGESPATSSASSSQIQYFLLYCLSGIHQGLIFPKYSLKKVKIRPKNPKFPPPFFNIKNIQIYIFFIGTKGFHRTLFFFPQNGSEGLDPYQHFGGGHFVARLNRFSFANLYLNPNRSWVCQALGQSDYLNQEILQYTIQVQSRYKIVIFFILTRRHYLKINDNK